MSYYSTCPDCGAHLDPGEICEDCQREEFIRLLARATPETIHQVKTVFGKEVSANG